MCGKFSCFVINTSQTETERREVEIPEVCATCWKVLTPLLSNISTMQICLLDPNAENKSWKLLKRFSFDQKYSFIQTEAAPRTQTEINSLDKVVLQRGSGVCWTGVQHRKVKVHAGWWTIDKCSIPGGVFLCLLQQEIKPRTVLSVTHPSHGSLKEAPRSRWGGRRRPRTSCLSTQLAAESFRRLHGGSVEKL